MPRTTPAARIRPSRWRGPCLHGGTGRGVGVLLTCLDGDQHRSPLRDPRPGDARLPRCIKAYGHERHTVYVGRRDKPVRKLRSMPMASSHELAKKLQGRFGTTVSVV